MVNIRPIANAAEWLGLHQGEHQHLAVRTFGTIIISPFVMIYSPGPQTREAKNERKYAAVRQPVSGIVAAIVALAATEPVNRFLKTLASEGKLPETMKPDLALKTMTSGDKGILKALIKKYKGQIVLKPEPLTLQYIFNKLGGEILLSTETKAQLSQAFTDSNKLRILQLEAEKLLFKAERFAEKVVNPGLTEAQLVKKIDQKVLWSQVFKNFPKLEPLWKEIAEQHASLSQQSKNLTKELTRTLENVIKSSGLNKRQLEDFNSLIVKKFPPIFDKYAHIAMWLFAVVTLPIASIIVNGTFPQFVKIFFPKLHKAVKEDSVKDAGGHHK